MVNIPVINDPCIHGDSQTQTWSRIRGGRAKHITFPKSRWQPSYNIVTANQSYDNVYLLLLQSLGANSMCHILRPMSLPAATPLCHGNYCAMATGSQQTNFEAKIYIYKLLPGATIPVKEYNQLRHRTCDAHCERLINSFNFMRHRRTRIQHHNIKGTSVALTHRMARFSIQEYNEHQ